MGLYTMTVSRAMVAYRVSHRTVATDPPTIDAFMSNQAQGVPPRGPELDDPSPWEGISGLDTLERALKRARQFPMHGGFVAEPTSPPAASTTAQRTLRTPGHYTLHGSPQDLLDCVTQVFAIESPQEGAR